MESFDLSSILTPGELFGEHTKRILDMITDHSPFPKGRTGKGSRRARLHAAQIHLSETVYFGQIVYRALNPEKTVEVCSGYGLPTLTMVKCFGTEGICVDMDDDGLAVGRVIAEKLGLSLTQVREDLFSYLRREGPSLCGTTLMATAAFCCDRERGRPPGSGEGDLVDLAIRLGMNLAILPYRSGETMRTGVSQERKRFDDYTQRLVPSGYRVHRHPTKNVLPQTGAPDWFYLEILTAEKRPES
ncbi:MAG: hypothetical protein GX147_06105 [Deltaproteobacteria bacterium]|nr:hypothetical protein [Deltaproteobacteria bacterium]